MQVIHNYNFTLIEKNETKKKTETVELHHR